MTFFNPLAGSILPGSQAQQAMAQDKVRQMRRAQAVARNVAPESERTDQQVENVEELSPVNKDGRRDEQPPEHHRPKRDEAEGDDERPEHIDVRA